MVESPDLGHARTLEPLYSNRDTIDVLQTDLFMSAPIKLQSQQDNDTTVQSDDTLERVIPVKYIERVGRSPGPSPC